MATVKELAEMLDVSESTIRRWVKKGNIKHTMEGQKMMIDEMSFWTWCYEEWGYTIPEGEVVE